MNFFTGFGKGVGYFFKSLNVIFGKGLWHFLAYPALLKIIYVLLVFFGLLGFGAFMHDYIEEFIKLKDIPDSGHWLSWLKHLVNDNAGLIAWIITWIIKLIIAWLLGTMSKYIVLIILSPVLSLVSEATEEKMLGNKFPFDFGQLMKDILRGTLIALRNMFIEYGLLLAGFVLFLIPVLGPILFVVYSFFLWFVSWYFYGFAMLDYNSERHKMKFRESLRFVWENKGIACGIGFVYAGMLNILDYIPFIGSWIALMFVPIMGAVGASMAFMEVKNLSKKTDTAVAR